MCIFPPVQKLINDKHFWLSTAGEAEEEEEKNGAEEEADEHPVKRPAEEEVGLSFSPHTDTNPDVSSMSNLCLSAYRRQWKQRNRRQRRTATPQRLKSKLKVLAALQ